MTPTSFKETNMVYGAGDNPNTDQLAVAVCTCEHTPNVPFVVSKWKLSDEEIQYIVENKSMYISVMGAQIAPILPIAADPFGDYYRYTPLDL